MTNQAGGGDPDADTRGQGGERDPISSFMLLAWPKVKKRCSPCWPPRSLCGRKSPLRRQLYRGASVGDKLPMISGSAIAIALARGVVGPWSYGISALDQIALASSASASTWCWCRRSARPITASSRCGWRWRCWRSGAERAGQRAAGAMSTAPDPAQRPLGRRSPSSTC